MQTSTTYLYNIRRSRFARKTLRVCAVPLASLAVLALLAGCGGSGGNTGTIPSSTATPGAETPVSRTRVGVSWQWPDLPAGDTTSESRAIPRYARSLKITVQQYAPVPGDSTGREDWQTLSAQTVTRPDNGGTARVEFTDVPRLPGRIQLIAEAYEGPSAGGQKSATATAPVDFTGNGSPPDVVLTLRSTATRLDVSAPASFLEGTFAGGNLECRVGDSVPVSVTARDDANNIVLLDSATELRFAGDAANGNYIRLDPTTGGYVVRGVSRSPGTDFRPGFVTLSAGPNASGTTLTTPLNVRVKTRIEFTDVKAGIERLSATSDITDFLPGVELAFTIAARQTETADPTSLLSTLTYFVEVRDANAALTSPPDVRFQLGDPRAAGVFSGVRDASGTVLFTPLLPGKLYTILVTHSADGRSDYHALNVKTRAAGTSTITGPATAQAGTTATFVVRDANGQLSSVPVTATETIGNAPVAANNLLSQTGSTVLLRTPLDGSEHNYVLQVQGGGRVQVNVPAITVELTQVDTASGGVRKQITARIVGLDNTVNGETGQRTLAFSFTLSGDTQEGKVTLTPTPPQPGSPVAAFAYNGTPNPSDTQTKFTVSATAAVTINRTAASGGTITLSPITPPTKVLNISLSVGSGNITIN